MKTKVGEYKGKIIVEGGENPQNELKPYEMLFPTLNNENNENNAHITVVSSTTGVRVTNVTGSLIDYQLIQVVLPNSPFYGEVEGTQTRVNIVADSVFMGDDSVNYEDAPFMDVFVYFINRNGFPFDPEHYRACRLRIVKSVEEIEMSSNTIIHDGCVPSVKFIKYTTKLDN